MRPRSFRPTSARALPRLAVSGAACLLLIASAAGCGSETGDSDDPGSATDSSSGTTPAGTPSASSTAAGAQLVIGETVEPGQAVIVSESNVKGDTSTRASALVNEQSIDSFLAAMDARLADSVRGAVRTSEVPDDSTLFGVVASVGCDEPTAITWTKTFEGIEATPALPKSDVQCLVPVTSVALFLVPN